MPNSIDVHKGLNLAAANKSLETTISLLEKVYDSTMKLNKAILEGSKAIGEAAEATKAKKQALSEVQKLEAQNIKIVEKYKAATSEASRELIINKVKLQERNKAIRESAKSELAAVSSVKKAENAYKTQVRTLNDATKQNKALREAVRNTDATTKKGQATIKKYNTIIGQNTDFIQKNVDGYVQRKMNIGNYSSALSGLPGPIGKVGSSLTTLSSTFKVLLANPVVLIVSGIVLAFTGLMKILQSSQPLVDAFDRTMAGIGATFSVVRDRIIQFFENLQSGETTIKDLGTALVDNILNRFKAVVDVGGAVGRMFKALWSRDMKGLKASAEDAGRALVQLNTGLDPAQQKKMADGVKDVADEIKEEASAATLLEKQQQALEDREIEAIGTLSKLRRERELALKASKDQTLSDRERIKFMDEYLAKTSEIEGTEVALARERARISQAEVGLGKSDRDELRANAELQAGIADIEAKAAQSKGRAISLRSGLINKLAQERKNASEQMIADTEAEWEAEMDADMAIEASGDAVLNNQIDNWDKAVEANQEKIDKLLDQEIAKNEALAELEDEAKERFKLGIMENLEALALAAETGKASGLALYNNMEQVATEAFSNITAAQINSIDSQLQALEAKRDAEGNLNKRDQDEYVKLQRERAQIQRKQAIAEKVAGITAASISTARAIMAMLEAGAWGIPLSIAAGVTGATQIAAIATQPLPPIPQFFKGTKHAQPGLKWVGEKGTEALEKNGGVYFTPNRATLINTDGGERIRTHTETVAKYGASVDTAGIETRLDKLNSKPVIVNSTKVTQGGIEEVSRRGLNKYKRITKWTS